jgi:hypothetical protein
MAILASLFSTCYVASSDTRPKRIHDMETIATPELPPLWGKYTNISDLFVAYSYLRLRSRIFYNA